MTPADFGIERRRAGKGFTYTGPGGRTIEAENTLARIRALAIPPAWTDVWICSDADGHLQAIGRDARGRRQYRYHAAFRARRDSGKFERIIRFGEALPRIRRQVGRDLGRPGLPRQKVLAAVVNLLESTRFRVGNAEYARLNRSFGISTLRARHATVSGTTVRFRFRGKGGRTEERALVDRRMAAVVRRCQDLPGQSLFQYLDEEGEARGISSEDVNDYIRDAAGSDEFSAKDFRTWTATVLAHQAVRRLAAEAAVAANEAAAEAATRAVTSSRAGSTKRHSVDRGLAPPDQKAPPAKRIVSAAIEITAEALGDTVTVTRNSYVHPAVLEAPLDPDGGASGTRRPTRRSRSGSATPRPTRKDELEVLATLRAARRSQVRSTGGADRKRVRAS
ncbi:MAG TPA: DNA topoisomerase IB [Candidatus Limnocylindria bacterium]|nr:DNA topoisomerase IB [Candidatus Limnocylindria bacterium]